MIHTCNKSERIKSSNDEPYNINLICKHFKYPSTVYVTRVLIAL